MFNVMLIFANSVIITFYQWVSEKSVYCCSRDQTGNPYERKPLWQEHMCVQRFGITSSFSSSRLLCSSWEIKHTL